MEFGKVLLEKRDQIVTRWFDGSLALYPDIACDAFRRQHDQFANPVGHSLRTAVAELFDAVCREADDQVAAESLTEVVKIRAVQEFPPSDALRFVFLLKSIVRNETGVATDPEHIEDLRQFDERIDRIALLAFDTFVHWREKVFELRVEEAKRRVKWVVDRLNRDAPATAAPGTALTPEPEPTPQGAS